MDVSEFVTVLMSLGSTPASLTRTGVTWPDWPPHPVLRQLRAHPSSVGRLSCAQRPHLGPEMGPGVGGALGRPRAQAPTTAPPPQTWRPPSLSQGSPCPNAPVTRVSNPCAGREPGVDTHCPSEEGWSWGSPGPHREGALVFNPCFSWSRHRLRAPAPTLQGNGQSLGLGHVGRDRASPQAPAALGSWPPPQTQGDLPLDIRAMWGPPEAWGPDAEMALRCQLSLQAAASTPSSPAPLSTGGDGPASTHPWSSRTQGQSWLPTSLALQRPSRVPLSQEQACGEGRPLLVPHQPRPARNPQGEVGAGPGSWGIFRQLWAGLRV